MPCLIPPCPHRIPGGTTRPAATRAAASSSAAAGELRWIQSLNRSILSDIYVPSDIDGGTATESTDIHTVGGQTRSKYYSNRQAMSLTVRGVTGSGVGVFMDFGTRESSAGGPFFRDIEQQGTDDSIQVYNYLYSAHDQTESQRVNVMYGPYALMVTNGSVPAAPDLSFMYGFGFQGGADQPAQLAQPDHRNLPRQQRAADVLGAGQRLRRGHQHRDPHRHQRVGQPRRLPRAGLQLRLRRNVLMLIE